MNLNIDFLREKKIEGKIGSTYAVPSNNKFQLIIETKIDMVLPNSCCLGVREVVLINNMFHDC